VHGEVEAPIVLSYAELQALPQTDVTLDIHCVTRWSRFDVPFRGVRWRELASLARPTSAARFAVAHAEHGYTTNVPLAALEDPRALLAWEADGEPLTPEHGWPLRLVVPKRYAWKSAKWLTGLEFTDKNKRGFWEVRGYHIHAEPFGEERYSYQEGPRAELEP
jgi:DMSO/TMAO reductase YedYZ molybdopterin-dependent catalytic subunit